MPYVEPWEVGQLWAREAGASEGLWENIGPRELPPHPSASGQISHFGGLWEFGILDLAQIGFGLGVWEVER
jgi:hypothetical protein